jgi:Mrp family chromosome partitioning ATPase
MMKMAKKHLDEIARTRMESSVSAMMKRPSELIQPPVKIRDRRRAARVSAGPMEGKMQEEMVQLHQVVVSALQQSTHVLIQFTGSLAGEGTSTVAKEFARVSSTKFKKRTLLFDADWRQAALRPLSRRTDPITIERAVRNGLPLEQAMTCVQKPLLFTCLLSADPEFCPDLYDLAAMKRIWSHLKETFDVVVVDSPPAADYQDSAIIAKDMDGAILVLKAESTRWPVAVNVKQGIADNGGKILGMALNDRRFYLPDSIYRRL